MNIVCDENIPLADHYFASLGEITYYPGRHITAQCVRDADVLLVRSVTTVNAALLHGSRVRFVGTATIGEDHIDKDYLAEAGIVFANAPGCNANSVAEYVLAALFDWWLNPSIIKSASALQHLRIAIVGLGNVGSRVKTLCEHLQISTVCYDPFKASDTAIPFDEICNADVITFHTPLTKSGAYPTHHLADQRFLSSLKPGALLINSGRGAVFDNAALLQRLTTHTDLSAVLDVWEGEPQPEALLIQACYLSTPHIAGYSYDGKIKGTQMLFQSLRDFLGQSLPEPAAAPVPLIQCKPSEQLVGDALINACIQQAYAIRRDDDALKQAARQAQSTVQLGRDFDRLRKYYPQRREFGAYQLVLPPRAKTEAVLLERMGFKLVQIKDQTLKA